MVDLNVSIDEETVLKEIRDSIGIKSVLDELKVDEEVILDEFYFSEILDYAILRDQAAVESDITSSLLDLVPGEAIYDPSNIEDFKRFVSYAFGKKMTPEPLMLALKNEVLKYGWTMEFTKKI